MSLEQAIIAYGTDRLTPTNDWYQWRNINPRYLPNGIVLSKGNQYAQNVSLKQQLCAHYSAGNEDTKIAVTRYYIAVWGGVKRNSAEKIRNYSLTPPNHLIANGVKGIASWSKALCIRNPNEYAIYDARVALSLNAIQVVYRVENPILFPLLTGQNKLINNGSKRIRRHACEYGWAETQEEQFYQQYNAILSSVANALEVNHYTLEMLLFAYAPYLLSAAYPTEQF